KDRVRRAQTRAGRRDLRLDLRLHRLIPAVTKCSGIISNNISAVPEPGPRPHSGSTRALLVILTKRATRADGRISDSGAQAPPVPVLGSASDKNQDRCAISKTGAGFAGAKLSEILPSARVARFVRMTQRLRIMPNSDRPSRYSRPPIALAS